MRTDGRTYMILKLIVTYRNFANAPKIKTQVCQYNGWIQLKDRCSILGEDKDIFHLHSMETLGNHPRLKRPERDSKHSSLIIESKNTWIYASTTPNAPCRGAEPSTVIYLRLISA
jgi:hypothetical protein